MVEIITPTGKFQASGLLPTGKESSQDMIYKIAWITAIIIVVYVIYRVFRLAQETAEKTEKGIGDIVGAPQAIIGGINKAMGEAVTAPIENAVNFFNPPIQNTLFYAMTKGTNLNEEQRIHAAKDIQRQFGYNMPLTGGLLALKDLIFK